MAVLRSGVRNVIHQWITNRDRQERNCVHCFCVKGPAYAGKHENQKNCAESNIPKRKWLSREVVRTKRPEARPNIDKPPDRKPEVQTRMVPEKLERETLLLLNITHFPAAAIFFHLRFVVARIPPIRKNPPCTPRAS